MNLLVAGIFCGISHCHGFLSALPFTSQQDSTLPVGATVLTYHYDTLKSKNPAADFSKMYTETERRTLLAINRISPSLVRKGRVLVMPDTLLPDMRSYSPFPDSLPAFDSLAKLVLISRRVQAFALYENGGLIRWGPVSSGKKSTPTPAGLFHTNFKAEIKISSENSTWIMPWYFNFYAARGIAMHQYFLPGYPASHACVRMQEEDALFIFNWAEQKRISSRMGTPVILFGDYDYSKKQPWLNLPADSMATAITPEELEEIHGYLPVIHRDVVLRK